MKTIIVLILLSGCAKFVDEAIDEGADTIKSVRRGVKVFKKGIKKLKATTEDLDEASGIVEEVIEDIEKSKKKCEPLPFPMINDCPTN